MSVENLNITETIPREIVNLWRFTLETSAKAKWVRKPFEAVHKRIQASVVRTASIKSKKKHKKDKKFIFS